MLKDVRSNKVLPFSSISVKKESELDLEQKKTKENEENEINFPYPIIALPLSFPLSISEPQNEEFKPNLKGKKSSGRLVSVKRNLENEAEQKLSEIETMQKNLSVTFKTPEIDELWNCKKD